jgi:hypothetical protein
MDEATAVFMEKQDVWLSTQPFVGDDDTVPLSGQSRINLLQVFAGTNTVYALAKEHKIKTAFGTDLDVVTPFHGHFWARFHRDRSPLRTAEPGAKRTRYAQIEVFSS